MTMTAQTLLDSARSDERRVIAMSEGSDPRIVAGALAARDAGIADIILVGDQAEVAAQLEALGRKSVDGVAIHDPLSSDLAATFAEAFFELRKHKGVDMERAEREVRNPLVYAAMLVRQGHAAGTVGGAVAATPDIVRAALQVIGKAKDAPLVSSFFLMFPPSDAGRAMVYADCGLVIDPSSEEQAAIAEASSRSCKALLETDPKVAFLSFSTKGSARHAMVDKVSEAAAIFAAKNPQIPSDGELQFDTAFVPSVGDRKAPDSAVAGKANVMIFPSLDAGNIAYKITQRLGGYAAIGPILQGLKQPANDLSRGCSAEDVTTMIAVTVKQAG
ncbi:MAG: phosphate acetyltransferase [Paracoccaceae bacterium]|nr:phosphate acetyltransferase [Paracoccaceae bacterium]MDG1739551.1 phosphate acetyltransferase [Paracoccaceae bacterium]MDG2258197.1 phosphate acetyltransferase [Paracoccaceae bacterium]